MSECSVCLAVFLMSEESIELSGSFPQILRKQSVCQAILSLGQTKRHCVCFAVCVLLEEKNTFVMGDINASVMHFFSKYYEGLVLSSQTIHALRQ